MVWWGEVRCGKVGYGLVRYGLVGYGEVRQGTVLKNFHEQNKINQHINKYKTFA